MKKIISLALLAMMAGCSSDSTSKSSGSDIDISQSEPMRIERLDTVVTHFGELSPSRRDSLLSLLGEGAELYLSLKGSSGDTSTLAERLRELSESRVVTVFGTDVEKRIGDLDSVERQLGGLSRGLAAHFPKARLVNAYGVITPWKQGVITADSTALVALNLYLGPGYEGYSSFDEYFKRSRVKGRIPYDAAESLLAGAYPGPGDQGVSVLQALLWQGALINAEMMTVPESDLAMAIGMSDDDLRWCRTFEGRIWKTMIDNNLVYSTNPMDAAKLLNPAPSCPQINANAPGRVGRFIGYQIVRSYIENHPDVDPEDLLKPQFFTSPRALIDAQYNPKES